MKIKKKRKEYSPHTADPTLLAINSSNLKSRIGESRLLQFHSRLHLKTSTLAGRFSLLVGHTAPAPATAPYPVSGRSYLLVGHRAPAPSNQPPISGKHSQEEHYISKLNFTWPHVSCLPGCPPRGSKIVFMSYKDHLGEASTSNTPIQKFAVRFLITDETERFMNFIKEIFGYEKLDRSTPDISTSKTSSQSEKSTPHSISLYLASLVQMRSLKSKLSSPIIDWSPIGSNNADSYSQVSNPMESTLSQDVQEKLSAFPPSFTSLLTMATTQETLSEEVILKNEIMFRHVLARRTRIDLELGSSMKNKEIDEFNEKFVGIKIGKEIQVVNDENFGKPKRREH
ncbi:hypothetical protein LXL04_035498 [Taraxacum kok-saghyz]